MSDESQIRQSQSHQLATFGAAFVSGVEDCVTTAALTTRTSEDLHRAVTGRRYVAPMGITTTAADIAAALRDHLRTRIAYLPDRKMHALLYLAQGLALTPDGEPLFPEPITATDIGVRVDYDSTRPPRQLDDTQFGIVAVTAGRYGGLSAMDLEALIRGQRPWQAAGLGQPISLDRIRNTFRSQDETPEGTVSGFPRSVRTGLHPPADPRRSTSAERDSAEGIAAFIADVKARM